MIYQNVPYALFEALRRSGCIMYYDTKRIESISLDRVLSVYNDRIIVYNYDNSIRFSGPATHLMLFKVQYIDQFYHVFTEPFPIMEEFIDKVKNNDRAALMFGDDSTCEAISMALRALEMPPFCFKYPTPILFSSVSELPDTIQDTMSDKIENGEDVGLINPYPNREHMNIEMEEHVVPHIASVEELYTMFDPWALTDRGREIAGITEDQPPYLETTTQDDEVNIACTKEDYKYFKEAGNQIRQAGPPVKIGTNIYSPALIKVVDEVKPPMPEPPPAPVRIIMQQNPIGYVDPPPKPSKKK